MRLLLSMGLKPGGTVGEPLRPRLRWLDADTGEVTDAWSREPPPAVHPGPREHAEFTGAHRHGDVLVQTTRTEVLFLSWPDLSLQRVVSHPLLHDVHDATLLPGGSLAVSASGHDSVLVFDAAGRLRAHHHLRPAPFAATFAHVDDFRQVPFDATKPHHAHPNRVFWWRDALWTTCLVTRQARCLTADLPPLSFDAPPHDGCLRDGSLWFTTVDGHVLAHDAVTGERTLDLDLVSLGGSRRMPGWCRGVEKVGPLLYVGMTTLRSPRHRELLRWIAKGEAGVKAPTRVVVVDPRGPEILAEHPVGNEAGGTLYGITACPSAVDTAFSSQ